MIKRETIKRTRDFLNSVKRGLPVINRGHITMSDMADLHQVSDGRIVAAVDLGYFRPVGYRGKRPVYKSTVPYFNEDMAAAVIRREYNRYAVKEVRGEPVAVKRVAEKSPRGENIDAISVLQEAGYRGMLFRKNEALSDLEVVVL
jgi:hypothetical protein